MHDPNRGEYSISLGKLGKRILIGASLLASLLYTTRASPTPTPTHNPEPISAPLILIINQKIETGTVTGYTSRHVNKVALFHVPHGLPSPDEVCSLNVSDAMGLVLAGYVDDVKTQEDGSFCFENVPTGIPLYVFSSAKGCMRYDATNPLNEEVGLEYILGSPVFILKPGETIDLGDVSNYIISCPCYHNLDDHESYTA